MANVALCVIYGIDFKTFEYISILQFLKQIKFNMFKLLFSRKWLY